MSDSFATLQADVAAPVAKQLDAYDAQHSRMTAGSLHAQ
ncbi:hypothetical protein F4827_005118 [Paraburkholderia bannensis]|uniref:Uncharacterized protein n=1 Tax=Paraburkholderia bannensis TaxID=765414 RepID=A0A7W9WVD5_9BURK|nr:hypothetical protein [Paraburkholderia sp. WP4_3_2]MBB6105252.1 hypothetical protein [Paraburkholderia bannensis]